MGPDTLQISDILRLPRFKFRMSIPDPDSNRVGNQMKSVEVVCYGFLYDGEYVRDPGEYLVKTLYTACGDIVAENVKAKLLNPDE